MFAPQYDLDQWENIFQMLTRCQIHLGMVFTSITNIAGYIYLLPKINCGWTDDICLVLAIKSLSYLLSICYWSMEQHFSEVKKMSEPFSYGLHQH